MKNIFQSRIFFSFCLLFLVFLAGVFGFIFLFDYKWIDAAYMTVITITTVGYGELHPLGPSEKIFTSLFILASVLIVGYSIKVITENILSQSNIGNLRQKKVQKKIQSLENHVVICGYGRNGMQAVHKLMAYDTPFVIIERDEEVVERYSNDKLLFVHGNASEDEILVQAGIERAKGIIANLEEDSQNIFVVLTARTLNEKLFIV